MLTKMVNGERVQMTPEEEAEIRAEWAKPPPEPEPEPLSVRELADILKTKGVLSQADMPARLRGR